MVSCPGGEPSYVPQFGTLHVQAVDRDTIAVTTAGGCTSTLDIVEALGRRVLMAKAY